MTTLAEIKDVLDRIEAELPALISRAQISPNQIAANTLDQISSNLGLVAAGEFRSGNGVAPGQGFTGTRIAYPAMTYSGNEYNIVGVASDVLKTGINATTGLLYATDATISGTITATLGAIGGFIIGATFLTDAAGVVGLSSAVTGGDDIRLWAGHATPASAPFRVTEAGALVATSATITGAITASSGSVGGWTIATDLSSGSLKLVGATPAILMGSATDYLTGAGVFIGLSGGAYKSHIGNPAGNYLAWDATNLVASGQWIASAGLNPGLQEWKTDIVFSSTDADTIAWTSGTVRLGDGTTYSITAGNTGNMAALTYIYIDTAVSLTAFQLTTTYSTAVGDGKILIASAQNNAVAASVIPFGGQQPVLDGAGQIAALSITAGAIAAGAVTATKISVTNLAAISATMGALTVDNKLTMSGASSAIAIGTTPPTSATAGTGLWLDKTGLYGLASDVQQAYLLATDGSLYAGAGTVILDADGITMLEGATTRSVLKWVDANGNLITQLSGNLVTSTVISRTILDIAPPTSGSYVDGEFLLRTHNQTGAGYAGIDILASEAGQSYIDINDDGRDVDTYVESENATAIFVNAANDTISFFGGTAMSALGPGPTYTPSLTNVTNLSASSASQCMYYRIGNLVHVSGKFTADPTASGACEIGISLPIASNLANDYECAGTGAAAGQQTAGKILGDTTNDRATMTWNAIDGTNRGWGFEFTYMII